MKLSDISTSDVYRRESMDFRFFLKWFQESLQKIKYDHDHIVDLYDPLRCPKELLWMLADTMGYKYDSRLPVAFCRLVLLYFMSMIRLRGSKNGVTLAAEVNLAQQNIKKYGEENDILYNRLEDTSIPVNAVSVVPHVKDGYIEVVYFSESTPVDACLEYVRPVGMYLFARHGVTVHARTKIWVDAMLTDRSDMNLSIGPTRIGHYSREDYARLQNMTEQHGSTIEENRVRQVEVPNFNIRTNRDVAGSDDTALEPHHRSVVKQDHTRRKMWRRNVAYEVSPDDDINPGYRALYNLQMSNNQHIVESLIPKMFSLGFGPHTNPNNSPQFRENHPYSYGDTVKYQGVVYVCLETYTSSVTDSEGISGFDKDIANQKWMSYLDFYEKNQDIREDRPWDIKNLRHRDIQNAFGDGWSYLDTSRTSTTIRPKPRVNPILAKIGDAIAMSPNPLEEYSNEKYTKSDDPENKGNDITVHPQSDM